MKNILIISSRIPYPLTAGYRLRIYNFARILSKKYNVDLLAINENNFNKTDFIQLKYVFKNIKIFNISLNILKLNALIRLPSNKPIQVSGYYFNKIQKYIHQNYANYDLIICNHIRTAEYIRKIKCKKIIDFHDAISMNYKEAINNAKGFWKAFYYIENKRLLNYEIKVISEFDKTFITSNVDKKYLCKSFKNPNKIAVLPMGVKDELFCRLGNKKEKNWITFIGKIDYNPNEDASIYFAKDIFPLLKKEDNTLEFYIIGANPTRRVLKLQEIEGVNVTGYLEDPYNYIEKSKIVVAPMRFGAGIQNKILEGMALGKVVVTTSKGARGISGEDGKHFIVVNGEKETAEEILDLLNNKQKRKEIEDNAKKLINEKYRWDIIAEKLYKEIDEVLGKN